MYYGASSYQLCQNTGQPIKCMLYNEFTVTNFDAIQSEMWNCIKIIHAFGKVHYQI